MTTLTGSEKQVVWAQNIVTEWDASFARMISDAKSRVEHATMPANWLDHVTAIVDQTKARIATLTKASDIIDMKQRSNAPAMVEKQIAVTWKA